MKPMTDQHLEILRRHMVEMIDIHFDLASDEIGKETLDPEVRDALLKVPRHLFVPAQLAILAYQDTPLPLGFDKTVSQPFIAGLMIDLLDVKPGDRILEVGTGLGYQAALLAELGARVWSVEIVEEFANEAKLRLTTVGYGEIAIRVGDGSRGWAEHAPFDKILVTAAAKEVPPALLDQLGPDGRIVLPIGPKDEAQQLSIVDKVGDSEIHTRGAVHDDVRPYRVQQRNDGTGVLEIRGHHAIMRGSRYAHHIMAGADELAASGTSQEAACAGHQHLHHYAFLDGRAMTVTLRPMPHLVIAWQRASSGAMPFSASRRSNSTRAL